MKFLLFLALGLSIGSCKTNKDVKQSQVQAVADENTANGMYDLTLIGLVPGEYHGKEDVESKVLSKIVVKKGLIFSLEEINENKVSDYENKEKTIILRNKTTKKYDLIFPGLIDLHNHTKQNVLPVWTQAKGQFENRFEWRAWGKYKKSVSGNMNSWIGFGKPITCASFRWSEMQAMVLGTTYLQGPSSCIQNFAIHQVEDANAYAKKRSKISAPTDLILPNEMVFIWNDLKEYFDKGMNYEQALQAEIVKNCPSLKGIVKDVLDPGTIKLLSEKKYLEDNCDIENAPSKFLRYVYWVHKSVASKKNYFKNDNYGALIFHLAEGRQTSDKYNTIEYDMVKLLGLIRKHVNFVHAVGVPKEKFPEMASAGVGVIWSPFSNTLLYGETLDVPSAFNANVKLALGSDWLPTGTRGVLDELKVAKAYVDKFAWKLTDQDLVHMVTKNPAEMINQEGIVGTIAEGAMGSFMIVSDSTNNPYSTLVETYAENVNLVIVDGKPIYGNKSYILSYNKDESYEVLDVVLTTPKDSNDIPSPDGLNNSSEKLAYLEKINEIKDKIMNSRKTNCDFSEEKVFVHQDSLLKNGIEDFKANLDRYEDIQELLAVNLTTQSRNLNEDRGDSDYAVKEMAPLFSCDDSSYMDQVKHMISRDLDKIQADRDNLRETQGLGATPKKMAEKYNL